MACFQLERSSLGRAGKKGLLLSDRNSTILQRRRESETVERRSKSRKQVDRHRGIK